MRTATKKIEAFAQLKMVIRTSFGEAVFTASRVVHDPDSKAVAIVDPVLDYGPTSGLFCQFIEVLCCGDEEELAFWAVLSPQA